MQFIADVTEKEGHSLIPNQTLWFQREESWWVGTGSFVAQTVGDYEAAVNKVGLLQEARRGVVLPALGGLSQPIVFTFLGSIEDGLVPVYQPVFSVMRAAHARVVFEPVGEGTLIPAKTSGNNQGNLLVTTLDLGSRQFDAQCDLYLPDGIVWQLPPLGRPIAVQKAAAAAAKKVA